jgi:hypothetical protein
MCIRSIIEKINVVGEQMRSPGSHLASWNLQMSTSFTVGDFQYSYRLGTLFYVITWFATVGDDYEEDKLHPTVAMVASNSLSSPPVLGVRSDPWDWVI